VALHPNDFAHAGRWGFVRLRRADDEKCERCQKSP
jgi:hypothetical protein